MVRYVSIISLLIGATAVATAQAATVSTGIVTAVSSPVPAGSTVPYEIHLVISDVGDAFQPEGLCLFALDLSSDLGVEQPRLQAFSLDVASSFTATAPQFGTPNSNGGLNGIAAAQNCDDPTVLGVGLPGNTLVARGELQMPGTPGQYIVTVFPSQVLLIRPEGGGQSPTAIDGGTLSITVGEAGIGTGDEDAGTDGAPGAGDGSAPPTGDGGTGGIGEGGSGDGTDQTGTDADTNGDNIVSMEVLTGGPAAGEAPSGGFCGFGMIGPIVLAMCALWCLRAVRRTGI
ncbi:MAG TPA: hypothetical protein VM243_12670 [Phycisphaerae bacterium]|nr:hypothetical protein [Phycisphaerae bacterium]